MSGHQSRLRDLPVPRADTEGKPFPAHQGKYNGSSSCLRCPSPMLPRSHVPASGAGREPCLSPPCCPLPSLPHNGWSQQAATAPHQLLRFPWVLPNSRLLSGLGSPSQQGCPHCPPHSHKPLDGFPLPKCELRAATLPGQE